MSITSPLAFEASADVAHFSSAPIANLGGWPFRQRIPSSASSTAEVLPATRTADRAKATPRWMAGVFRRVVALSKRIDDWDSYGAPPLQVEVLRAFVQVLDGCSYAIQSEPLVSLTGSGGLLCEWRGSQATVDLVFDPGTGVRVYYENVATGQEADVALQECDTTLEKWLWLASSGSQ